ncbi:carboxylesterase family protein [Hyphomicrobium sp. D-2]|uniref:carboxylesterase/lipase family protein n=1 Tax=Hyphomicrobium sp. D-2 TaxID=3041621 RepID=UPI00245549FF|nr:carboxylesterase family protein [Hyphomicrobium sp. D-2]MDH4981581.1 carboxylesterase family protein [Hyphomicrobium sp. D-2]
MQLKFSLAALAVLMSAAVPVQVAAAPPSQWGEAAIVETQGGKVAGFMRNGALEFRGIPYGMSVAGDSRWEPPKPAASWSGVLPAMHFKEPCAQAARYGLTQRSDNEDCLYLNVSLPTDANASLDAGEAGAALAKRKLPVIIWIHGGAFVGGSAALYRLDALARKADAVVVSMNYRLGVFGFMPHPAFGTERNGGYALEDQRLAMRWVQENIAAFGGDPDNVTIAGESAGAASVCMHLIAPEETKGLFHKAIVQSGACVFRLRNVEDGKNFGAVVAEKAGCTDAATVLQCMRGKDPQTLIAAGEEVGAGDLLAFAQTYGARTVPLQGLDAIASGKFARVPVLNGGTRDELSLYVGYDVQAGKKFTAENYDEVIAILYGDNAAKVLEQYPLSAYASAAQAITAATTDFRPDLGINRCLYLETARLMSQHVPVYQWEFADRHTPVLGVAMPIEPDPGFELGAAHSSELNAYFPNFSNTTAISGPDLPPQSQVMADQMTESWATFMRTGTPKADGAPAWKAYAEGAQTMRFEPGNIHAIDLAADAKCAFWQSLYPEYFAK